MPHHKSAIKRVRQAPKRLERNRADRSAFRTALKDFSKTVAGGNAEAAEKEAAGVLQIIGKTEKKGLIHRNKAARHQSAVMGQLAALKAKKAS